MLDNSFCIIRCNQGIVPIDAISLYEKIEKLDFSYIFDRTFDCLALFSFYGIDEWLSY